jgi:hypothetical protein
VGRAQQLVRNRSKQRHADNGAVHTILCLLYNQSALSSREGKGVVCAQMMGIGLSAHCGC